MTSSKSSSIDHGLAVPSEAIESLSEDVKYLWAACGCNSNNGNIAMYDEPLPTLDFLRNHIAVSRPCIIRNAILTKNGTGVPLKLTLDDLIQRSSTTETVLQVDVTPDGHGDCLRRGVIEKKNSETSTTQEVFVKPLQKTMTLPVFANHLRRGRTMNQQKTVDVQARVFPMIAATKDEDEKKDALGQSETEQLSDSTFREILDRSVLYYSRQNDCLRQELTELWNLRDTTTLDGDDGQEEPHFIFPRSFPWAEEAFGVKGPDACNLWIGDERAVSSMHKDHYENLFYVLSGEKVLVLCPPADAPFLYEQQVPSGQFVWQQRKDSNTDDPWAIQLQYISDTQCEPEQLHWIMADVNRQDSLPEFPLLQYTHPMEVRVQAGELLYLPSLWFHCVTQSCETVAINYWYDMVFESPLWCYFHFLQQLQPFSRQLQNKGEDEETD